MRIRVIQNKVPGMGKGVQAGRIGLLAQLILEDLREGTIIAGGKGRWGAPPFGYSQDGSPEASKG